MSPYGAVFWLLAGALSLGPPGEAFALGLKTAARELVVEGLEPGREDSLSERAGRSLSVENAGPETVTLELSARPPGRDELKDGYEPAQSGAWLAVERPRGVLGAGEVLSREGVLRVPGRTRPGRYQLQWSGTAAGAGGRGVTLTSRLLLHVGPQPAPWREPGGEPDGFKLLGRESRAEEVPLGGKTRLELKVANLSPVRLAVRVSPSEAGEEPLPEGGWERAPNPGFLKVAGGGVALEAGSVGRARLVLEIPDQERYRGRRWVFLVAVEADGPQGPERSYHRLLVTTQGKRRP